jgi:hypothetical protein
MRSTQPVLACSNSPETQTTPPATQPNPIVSLNAGPAIRSLGRMVRYSRRHLLPQARRGVERRVHRLTTGGEKLNGSSKLHALNACAQTEQGSHPEQKSRVPDGRVRWIADMPNEAGAATVTGVFAPIVFVGTRGGDLVVLADPSGVPNTEWTCSGIGTSMPSCAQKGFAVVPLLTAKTIHMPDGGNIGAVRHEPALARGRVFVATEAGHVYMLQPEQPEPDPCAACRPGRDCCTCHGGTWTCQPAPGPPSCKCVSPN